MAELDKLTVRSRAAAVLARQLDAETLSKVVSAMAREAEAGKVQAGKLVLDFIRFASDVPDDGGDNPEGKTPEEMTPAERAAARAELAREAEELARSLRGDADAWGGGASATRETT